MEAFILMGVVGPWQAIIIVAVILLLFGGKKIPELMRGLGKGIKEFKDGMNDNSDQNSQKEPKE
ncbi:MAG TPA: twin-arginine translocase TatA/TatE family subunit [Lentimicrobium sp.]|nr:twin-arginine translocase TatA/TatE family subunit [Lentimicrobium sp.]